MNIAVILASGAGKRMGAGKNKVLLSVCDIPILVHAIRCFHAHDSIDQIIITARTGEISYFQALKKKYALHKVIDVIEGGKERQDSSHNAIQHLRTMSCGSDDMVVFHNAANPFVTPDEITAVIAAAQDVGAAAVAHPTKDTIKEVDDDNIVTTTLDRSKLWNMQTPQAINFVVASEAFEAAVRDGYMGTDDVSLVEYLGKPVKIVEASHNNFKITTPRDLALAQLIMNSK